MTKKERQSIIEQIKSANNVNDILPYLLSFDSKIKWTVKQRLINHFNLKPENVFILP